jgi:Protein of unknown function (DUF1360)
MLALVFLLGLVTFRLVRLLQDDSITEPFRDAFYSRFPPKDRLLNRRPHNTHGSVTVDTVIIDGREYYSLADGVKGSFFGELFSCPWCLSFWVALLTVGFGVVFAPVVVPVVGLGDYVLLGLGSWAVSCLISHVLTK